MLSAYKHYVLPSLPFPEPDSAGYKMSTSSSFTAFVFRSVTTVATLL